MEPGLLIIDNNCYSRLMDPVALARFRANLRIADFEPQASEINLLESTAASPDAVQARLLASIRQVVGDRPLLPWPFQILKRIGEAIVAGEDGFYVEPSGKEWYLDDVLAASALRETILGFNQQLEKTFSTFHATGRKGLQSRLRAKGAREDFGCAREFLERNWYESDSRRSYAEVTWNALGLPGEAPFAVLEQNEAWRLLLDAEGVAVYERAIARVQPKFVQRLDLLQLIYLAGVPKRMIVTSDKGLLRAAAAILPGRYSGARAVHLDALIL